MTRFTRFTAFTALIALPLALALGAGQAIADETAAASVSVEIVQSVGIEPSHDGLAFSLSGQDGLTYDLVLPPTGAATDGNGRAVAIDLLPRDSQARRGSWILDGGSDVVELTPVIHRFERLATRRAGAIAPTAPTAATQPTGTTGNRDDEIAVFIAYQ